MPHGSSMTLKNSARIFERIEGTVPLKVLRFLSDAISVQGSFHTPRRQSNTVSCGELILFPTVESRNCEIVNNAVRK